MKKFNVELAEKPNTDELSEPQMSKNKCQFLQLLKPQFLC